MAKDNWPDLCEKVARDDGLPTREVGEWSQGKLFFWNKYVCTTTNAMVGNPNWKAGVCYVDLFSGPGICTVRESGKRVPGSPLIAAFAPKPFTKVLLVEMDRTLADACRSRLAMTPAADRFSLFEGDCNACVHDLVKQIPSRSLTLAFIDPEALDVRFETVGTLSGAGRVDLLVLFADAYDVVRNVEMYAKDPNSNLDQMLGADSNWRTAWNALTNRTGNNVRELFSGIYVDRLKKLGYREFGTKTIECGRGPLYKLIYASKHPRGLDFWHKVLQRDKTGQGGLFGPG
ncbi:MAG: three-Cys-motif partner protein TcmP [Phycisphaerales bacterium]|nr:three-Cys-motif partner protein TcmP [Phycisphaerales bacterium]